MELCILQGHASCRRPPFFIILSFFQICLPGSGLARSSSPQLVITFGINATVARMSEDDRQEASMRLDVDSDSAGTNIETSRDYGDGTLKEYEIFIESRTRLCEVSRVVYSLMQIQFEYFLVTMRNKVTSIYSIF